ncbi:peptidase S51 [Rodentibacter genomosp. 2]|uniref:Type 1 glutamine amidotransferase-like domain-containing protein n=1 Tax=Rodentibacter genomosp. 2 TaxID=1908266 RepID=UPI0009847DE9|nr:peptidase S51 [Rodentibacter genomosp. 2]
MSKKLFLTSYLAGTKNLLSMFLSPLKDKRVLFIPTAANVEEYTAYVDEALSVFKHLGIDVHVLDISQAEREYVISALENFPCLYVSGGNTFYLLQELKKKDLIAVIKKRILENLIYIGESAGAIIASENIDYIQLLDDRNKASALEEYSGLNLVNFYILPHYEEFPFVESTKNTMQNYAEQLNLLPINNHQAIIFNDEKYAIYEEV